MSWHICMIVLSLFRKLPNTFNIIENWIFAFSSDIVGATFSIFTWIETKVVLLELPDCQLKMLTVFRVCYSHLSQNEKVEHFFKEGVDNHKTIFCPTQLLTKIERHSIPIFHAETPFRYRVESTNNSPLQLVFYG